MNLTNEILLFNHFLIISDFVIFTTRRSYASAVLGVAILSVCLSVCLSLYYTRAL